MTIPVIGLMPGDPTGIGPEVLARVLAAPPDGARLVLCGDARVVARGAAVAGVALPLDPVPGLASARALPAGRIALLDAGNADPARLGEGRVNPEAGRATGETLAAMIRAALEGALDGICFAPLSKQALWQGGWRFHDEHQMFAALCGHRGFFGEMNVIPQFSTFRVTSHLALREALALITPERIADAVRLAEATLRAHTGKPRPAIGVAALNPHGGEGGLFGREEIEMIRPTLEALRAEGIACAGPIPADVIFLRALKGEFDGVVGMYHDQGQIATKLLNFNRGVTVTAGLAVPFTTPAHGTAHDIVGQGRADPGAMAEALRICIRLAGARRNEGKAAA